MQLLVCPHDLSMGGSQINAIDLAAKAADAGHDVSIYAIEGPLVTYVRDKGLRFIAADPLKYRPAPTRISEIAGICRRERIDLVHAYEWPPCLEAYYGATILCGVPVLCTMLSMTLPPYIPGSVPLIVGTAELADQARARRQGPVWCLEPPIDTELDHPGLDGRPFRSELGIEDDDVLVVTVSRLALDLKLDALVRAIDAADLLGARQKFRLAVVGDGQAAAALRERARSVNNRHGRDVVLTPGYRRDPRAAYAAADVVVGMGSSSMRAMSIGRPVVVQGEKGFSEIARPDTLSIFEQQGFYGLADDPPGAERLASQIASLIENRSLRDFLGRWGRATIVDRFSLARAADFSGRNSTDCAHREAFLEFGRCNGRRHSFAGP